MITYLENRDSGKMGTATDSSVRRNQSQSPFSRPHFHRKLKMIDKYHGDGVKYFKISSATAIANKGVNTYVFNQ